MSRRRLRSAAIVAALMMAVGLSGCGPIGKRTQLTQGRIFDPQMSDDGAYVTYLATRSGIKQLFQMRLSDRSVKQLTNANADVLAFSSTGAADVVVFRSLASNLVAGSTPASGLFTWSRSTNSLSYLYTTGGASFGISRNGTWLATQVWFNGANWIVKYRMADPTDTDGGPVKVSALGGMDLQISDDGRYIAYQAPSATVDSLPPFVRLLDWQTKKVLSVPSAYTNAGSTGASLSADGRYLAYLSPAYSTPKADPTVYLWDRTTGVRKRINPGAMMSDAPDLSRSGDFLTFSTQSNGLVVGDDDWEFDVFLWSRSSDSLSLLSDKPSDTTSVSSDGRKAAYLDTAGRSSDGSGRLVYWTAS